MTYRSDITKIIFDATMTPEAQVKSLMRLTFQAFDEGYDEAAQDITHKLQDLIPSSANTVPDARVQGAWRDAATVAYKHIGKRKT